jgi:hypothetical protein
MCEACSGHLQACCKGNTCAAGLVCATTGYMPGYYGRPTCETPAEANGGAGGSGGGGAGGSGGGGAGGGGGG